MKKRFVLVGMAAFFLVFILFSAFAKENKLPKPIFELLSGKTIDVDGVLSGMVDSQLPLALTVCDVLKHKALHKETKIPLEAVARFKTSIEKRLGTSSVVSFKKPPDYPQKIQAQEFEIDGKKIVVPEHFLAPGKLAITDVMPQGEVGSLFPEIVVFFANGKAPVRAKLTIGNKEYPVQLGKDYFAFQPPMTASSVFPLGVHKANMVLVDAENTVASLSWSFSIGEKPFQSPELSQDAKQIKVITIPSSSLVSGSTNYPSMKLIVYRNPDGQLCYEYCLPGKSGAMTKTTGLFLLGKILKAKKTEELLQIKPKTPCMFPDVSLDFSCHYDGPGSVTNTTWVFKTLEGSTFIHEPTATFLFKNLVLLVSCQLDVSIPLSEGSSGIAKDHITTQHYIRPFQFNFSDQSLKSLLPMRPPKTSAAIQSDRKIEWDLGEETIHSAKLVEDSPIQVADQGKLTVVAARWAHAGGTATPTIEFPEKDETTLEFESPGVAEMVHEVVMTFDWADEHYAWQFKPKFASLIAILPVEARALFAKFPPGIIAETKRKVIVKEYALSINGDQKTFKQPSDLKIAPPWVIAQSQEFPETKPLALSQLTPWFFVKKPDISLLSSKDGFTAEILYDGVLLPENEMPFRIYFPFLSLNKSAIPDLDQFPWLIPCGEWVPIKAYPNPAGLIQVEVSPSSQEMYEGQTFDFKAAIMPKEGLGTGKIDPDGGEIDLLEGYKSQAIHHFNWNARLLPEETSWKNGSGLVFAFEPKQGTGTYEIVASTVVEVKEVDTSSLAKVFGTGSATAKVAPGFKILSPIDKLYYPFGFPIQVKTSLDENPDEWKELQWFLNGKPWTPEPAEPHAELLIEKPGDYVLKALYRASDGIELSHEVAFFVKPAKVSIIPERTVLPFSEGLVFPLQGRIDFDGKILEDSEKPLDLGNGVSAKVTKVEWSIITNPGEGVEVVLEENLLNPNLTFRRTCAVTALATVSISISKEVKNQAGLSLKTRVVEEAFVLPAVRADLWGVSSPEWSQLAGHFPTRGINGTRRTFFPEEGSFTHDQKLFSWNVTSGISPKILMVPALPGVPGVTCLEIGFSWKGPENQAGDAPEFPVLFSSANSDRIQCTGYLRFDEGAKVAFPEKTFSVALDSLEKAVAAAVDPATFSISPGTGQKMTFLLQENGVPPVPAKTLHLWNGEYQADVAKVSWSSNGNVLGEGNPFDLSIPVKEQQIIKAIGTVSVQEADVRRKPAPATSHTMTAEAQAAIIRLIAYPGAGYVLPARSPFTLKARTDTVDPAQISWKLNDAPIGIGPKVPIQGLAAGDYTISASTPEFPGAVETREIKVFDWSFSLLPASEVLLWEGKKVEKLIAGNVVIANQTVSTEMKPITIGRAKIEPQPMTLIWQSESRKKRKGIKSPELRQAKDITCTVPEKLLATCTFENLGRFEALGSHSIVITQPDNAKETHFSNESGSLLGAITASARYSFAFEPLRAIVKMTRTYMVGSVTVKIASGPVSGEFVFETAIPQDIDPPVEIVKPFFPGATPIRWAKFDQKVFATNGKSPDQGISLFPVQFPDSNPVTSVWIPKLLLDSGQALELGSTSRSIKPRVLEEVIDANVTASPAHVFVGNPTYLNFYFGPEGQPLTEQNTLNLFKGDYMITPEDVEWFANGKPIPGLSLPSETWPPTALGEVRVSASSTFKVVTPEELSVPAVALVDASGTLMHVDCEVKSWSLTDLPDHLHGLGRASPNPATHTPYYEKDKIVWEETSNGKIATKPFAVAIDKMVSLEAALPRFKGMAVVKYQWIDLLNNTTALEGQVPFNNPRVAVPAPSKIGKYSVRLKITGSSEEPAELGPVYAVWNIGGNFKKMYFDDCLETGCKALSGMTTSASPRQILDEFYDKWWKRECHDLKYGEGGETVAQVICARSGMCKGLGNYFYKSLEAQGFPGESSSTHPRLVRGSYLMLPRANPWEVEKLFQPTKRGSPRIDEEEGLNRKWKRIKGDEPYEPKNPEYWGALVVEDPGLGQTECPYSLPFPNAQNAYFREPFRFQEKTVKLVPPSVLTDSSLFVDYSPDNISNITGKKCYLFAIGLKTSDGHAFVVFEEDFTHKYLYDPSFGKGTFKGFELDGKFPTPADPEYVREDLIVLRLGHIERYPKFLQYMKKSVTFLRSNTVCREPSSGNVSLRIIDVKWDNVNYLELRIQSYRSAGEE